MHNMYKQLPSTRTLSREAWALRYLGVARRRLRRSSRVSFSSIPKIDRQHKITSHLHVYPMGILGNVSAE